MKERELICEACGIHYFTTAYNSKWCPMCREEQSKIKAREYYRKRYEEKKTEMARDRIASIPPKKTPCDFCPWKTPGYRVCVMPRCMKNVK